MEKKEILANNLIKYRKSANLTQQEVADCLGYSNKAVSKWEHGESAPDVFTMQKLAEKYNIPMEYFLLEDEAEAKTQLIPPPAEVPLPPATTPEAEAKEATLNEEELTSGKFLPFLEGAALFFDRQKKWMKTQKKFLFLLLSFAILLTVTTAVFVILRMTGAEERGFGCWLLYVYDAPLIFTGSFVFIRCTRKIVDIITLTGIIWTVLACIFLSFMNTVPGFWQIFFLGIPAEFIAIFYCKLRNIHLQGKKR